MKKFIKFLKDESQRNIGKLQRQFYGTWKTEGYNDRGRTVYYIADCLVEKYPTANKKAREEILKVKEFMVKNIDKRLPRLKFTRYLER